MDFETNLGKAFKQLISLSSIPELKEVEEILKSTEQEITDSIADLRGELAALAKQYEADVKAQSALIAKTRSDISKNEAAEKKA